METPTLANPPEAPAPQGTKPGANRPPAAAPERAPEPRMIDFHRLPKSVQIILEYVDERDQRFVRAAAFQTPVGRDGFEVVRFVETTLVNSQRAMNWVGRDRLTGAERDVLLEKMIRGLGDVVAAAAELAKRSRLTEILQRNRPLIHRYAQAAAGIAARPLGARAPADDTTPPRVGAEAPAA